MSQMTSIGFPEAHGGNSPNVCPAHSMRTILAALSQSIGNLYDDMSYVLIRGLEGQIQQRQWSQWQRASFQQRRFNPRTSDSGGAVRRGHRKGLLTKEDKAVENTNKDKTSKHKKVRIATLIPCQKYLMNLLHFSSNKIYMSTFIQEVECPVQVGVLYK